MAKRPAEDDNISSINQYIGGNVSSNGDYNITNSVVNYNAGENAQQWLAHHASKIDLHTSFCEETFIPGLTDKIFQSKDFQDCLSNKSTTLVFKGRPGVGKTTTIHGLMSRLDKEPRKVREDLGNATLGPGYSPTTIGLVSASIFFRTPKRVSVDEHHPSKILLYLLQVISKQVPGSADLVKKLFESQHGDGQPLPSTIRRTLSAVLLKTQRACILIDAIDECAAMYLSGVLHEFQLLQDNTRIGLVITDSMDVTRKDLKDKFENAKFRVIEADPEDLGKYLRNRCPRDWNARLIEDVISGISKAANGIFLLARLYCSRLRDMEREVDISRELKIIIASRSTTDDATRYSIRQEFQAIIERIFHLERSGVPKDIARLAMGFVRDARRPLLKRELRWLLSTKETTRLPSEANLYKWDYIASCCHGLIEGDSLNNVSFIHHTILECVEDAGYENRIPPTNHELAKRCLYHLNSGDLDKGICPNPEALDDRLEKLPLLDYAARYWPHHFNKTPAVRCKDFQSDPVSETLHITARKFLKQDQRVEAAFQVTLFMDRNLQSYLNHVLEYTPVRRVALQFKQTEQKTLLDPFTQNKMIGLHIACQHGFSTIASEDIENNRWYPKTINRQNSLDYTPLHYAVKGAHLEIAKALLNIGADVNCRDISKASPLILATSLGLDEMAELLLNHDKGALEINAQTHHDHDYQEHEFELLLRDGIPELQMIGRVLSSVSERTALHYAARNGMDNTVARLLEKKDLKPDIRDSEGQSAWHKAAKYGHCNILKQFVKYKSDPRSRIGETKYADEPSLKMKEFQGSRSTAMHLAAKYGREETVFYLLAEFPDMCPMQNRRGATALSLATVYGQHRIVELILDKADSEDIDVGINIPDERNWWPLHYAAFEKSGKCTEWLLDSKLSKSLRLGDVEDNENMTPLHIAAIYGESIHVKTLLRHNVSIEKRTKNGFNAPELAVHHKNWRTFSALWEACETQELIKSDEMRKIIGIVERSNPPRHILDLLKQSPHALHIRSVYRPPTVEDELL